MYLQTPLVTRQPSVLIIPTWIRAHPGSKYQPPTTNKRSCSYMKIRPLYDRIVVKRIEEQETVRGGIIIPDSAKEKPQEGEVVAVGNGKRLEDGKLVALDVKVGDRILFG